MQKAGHKPGLYILDGSRRGGEPRSIVQEGRGRFTECARPMASSIQMKYQPISV
jgi:hypothetical protein